MIRLDCSGIRFGSQMDEANLFNWAKSITGFMRWEGDTLVMRSRLSQSSLRDLLALFNRYQIPMSQLAQFLNTSNEKWFASPQSYWHGAVFGQRPNPSLQPTAFGRG